jgi:hypothetical protein
LTTDRAGFHGSPSIEPDEKLWIIYQQYAKTARTPPLRPADLTANASQRKKGRDTVIPAFLTWLLQVPLVS